MHIKVPFLDLAAHHAPLRAEFDRAIGEVIDSGAFAGGPFVEKFEADFSAHNNSLFAVGVGSGTDALWLALAAAGVAAGDEVITTAFSFFATASSIIRAGARPVFVDIDPETLNLDPALVEQKLKSSCARRRAILPVHLYGQCADMTSFSRLGAEYKLVIIEDAAQAVGATWAGNKAGSMASAAAFSFYPTKNLGGFGDGGLITTNDGDLAARLRVLRDHGQQPRYYHHCVGLNSRLATLQAAFALCAAVAFAAGALLAPVGLWRQAVRALLWAGAATAALAWAAWGGIPWSELHWEATRNATVAVFSAIAFVPSAFTAMESLIRLLSDLPPVALALKTVVGLALAWRWHARLASALLAALDRLAAPATEARDASLSAQPGSPVVPNHT